MRLISVAFLFAVVGCGLGRGAGPSKASDFGGQPRQLEVAKGVLRWRDTGMEASLFGVNYYAPRARVSSATLACSR